MEANETTILRQELDLLREKFSILEKHVARLEEMGNFDRKNMLKFVNDRFKEMDVYIWPMFQKLFPDYAKAAESMGEIIKQAPAMHSYGKTPDGKEIL